VTLLVRRSTFRLTLFILPLCRTRTAEGANKSADSTATLRSMWPPVGAVHVDPGYFAILILVVVIALRIWRRRSGRGGGRDPFGRG
jgi:hypothetical protein